MSTLRDNLRDLVENLSEKNYDESFAQYRFWFDIGRAHGHITPKDQVYNDTRRIVGPDPSEELIHPTAHLLIRFIGDLEADQKTSNHAVGLHEQHSASALHSFFEENLLHAKFKYLGKRDFLTRVNLIAYWANLGHVEEETIRNYILQSLTSHPVLYHHQAEALFILFKLAGATFGAYADPSVIDNCFELLKGHSHPDWVYGNLLQVVSLRERGWEGLPPPPVFATGKSKPAGADQKDSTAATTAATPAITSLGLPSENLEPQPVPQPPPFLLESDITPEIGTIHASPVIQSPSLSIVALSDFAADTSDDESLIDSTAITSHAAFYLEDGNVEVLCGNTLFRVHVSVLSPYSHVLGQMLSKVNLAAAESPNGCPRILSSDVATDFVTLLKIVYLPAFPEWNEVPDFATFSSLFRITAKYEIPAVQSRLLDVVRDAYPETFEGLAPSKPLGEIVFSGPTHPNEVLNLFVQQKLTSALPMAYYMAARRGLDSLMDRRLPASARLPPEILQVAIKGLLTLREMELKETYRLICGSKGTRSCSQSNCPSHNATSPGVSEAHQKVVDRIADSAHPGMKLLQVLSLREVCGGDCLGFCESCVEGWEVGHAEVRKNAWGVLPDVFGLEG